MRKLAATLLALTIRMTANAAEIRWFKSINEDAAVDKACRVQPQNGIEPVKC